MKEKLSRRERAKADKRRRILEASAKLFALQGFEGTTVQEIADEADVAVGTLFLYVCDKGEILLLLFYEAIERQLKQATALLNSKTKLMPAVRRFLAELLSPYEKDPELARVFCKEFLFHKGKVKTELDAQTARIVKALHDRFVVAQTAGEVAAEIDAKLAALHIYAIYHATLAFHLAECFPELSSGDIFSPLLKSFWRGLEPR